MHTDKMIIEQKKCFGGARLLTSRSKFDFPAWSAVALHRFYHRIATAFPSSKAPEGWRSPKPGGSSHGSWKASPETKIRVHRCSSVVEKIVILTLKRDNNGVAYGDGLAIGVLCVLAVEN